MQKICAEVINGPKPLAINSIGARQFADGVAGLNDDLPPHSPFIFRHRFQNKGCFRLSVSTIGK